MSIGTAHTPIATNARQLLPFATPFLFGACCYFAVVVPFMFDERVASLIVILTFLVCLFGTAGLAMFAADENVRHARRIAIAATPTLLAVGAFLFLILVDSNVTRFLAVTGSMLLLALYYSQLDAGDDARFSALSRSIRAVALFFLLAFSFGIGRYVSFPFWLMVSMAGLVFAFSAHQDLRGMLNGKAALGHAGIVGILGGQAYMAFAFLPTTYMTNAAALLIGVETISTAMRNAVTRAPGALIPRRQLIAAALLLTAVLGTASWI
jgi:hypothetical protein